MIRIASIGECMVELAHVAPTDLQLAYGGDTLNTAVYLRRLTDRGDVSVDYVTALGDDAYSDAMLDLWQEEGLGIGLVARLPERLPGLYTIRTDQYGERNFTYWRGEAAARDMLRDRRDARLKDHLKSYDLVYLSGITLSILDQPQRAALFGILDGVRSGGGKIAFDGNFRPVGWPDRGKARTCFEMMLVRTDIALPTLDDEQMLFGDLDHRHVADRMHRLGVSEVLVKRGAAGCYLSASGMTELVPAPVIEDVVDSTAAGDSFNAGYLAARLAGLAPPDTAADGHRLAGRVIRYRGAVIPRDAMADLMPLSTER